MSSIPSQAPVTPTTPTMKNPTLNILLSKHVQSEKANTIKVLLSSNTSLQNSRSSSPNSLTSSSRSSPNPSAGTTGESHVYYTSRPTHSSGSDRSSIGGCSAVVSDDEDEIELHAKDEDEEKDEDEAEDEDEDEDDEDEPPHLDSQRLDFTGGAENLKDVEKAGKVAAMEILNAELQKISNTMETPWEKSSKRKSQVPERTLSPPLPLLERKVVRVTHNALDFRGKKAKKTQFNSPLHGSRSKPYHRVKQATVRSCLLRSLCRASKPNETHDSGNSNKNDFGSCGKSNIAVYDYMNCNCRPEEGSGALTFDSRFESGNLRKANKVLPRKFKRKFPSSRLEECQPMEVDQEYDVWCNNDLHTRGNTQWFYFSAGEPKKNNKDGEGEVGGESDTGDCVVKKGLRVRFNIVNMRKSDSLCNFGMKPVVLSLKELSSSNTGWRHEGEDVCYYRTPLSSKSGGGGGSSGANMYALSFVYTYKHDGDCVYFAYNYPYTFSRLQRLIHRLELDPVRQHVLRRRVLCHTLSGNACDILTVTAPIKNNDELRQRKIVIVSARVHPGETVASWMMHGLIDFITGNSAVACELREKIVFKLIPMLNPDGVINGNYRCSLAGIDLNRRWDRPSRIWHPTIWHTKQLIKQFNLPPNAGRVLAYIDLHGHSRKKNVFIYGCDPTKAQKRLIPKNIASVLGLKDIGKGSKKKSKKDKEKEIIKITKDAIDSGNTENMGLDEEEMKEIDEIVGIRVRSQLFAYVMSKTMSSSFNSGINLSMKDSNFSVRRSKKATARVVVWNECEVMNSITIEASFCGSGDNKNDKITKKKFVSAWKTGDVGYLSNAGGIGDSQQEENGDINDSNNDGNKYNEKAEVIPEHYSTEDLQAMGEIICRTVKGYLSEDSALTMMPRSMTPPLVQEGSRAYELTSALKLKELRKRELIKHRARMKLGLKSVLSNHSSDGIESDMILEDFMSDDENAGSDSNPSADEMDDEELQATGTFTRFISQVEKIHLKKIDSSKKKKRSKIKGFLASRKSRPEYKKKNCKGKEPSHPPSRSRLRRKADKKEESNKDSSDTKTYDLNMSHLMKRSENYREYKQQQQQNAETIKLQLQLYQSQKSLSNNKGGAIVSSFQSLMKNRVSNGSKQSMIPPGIVGSKRGGLNLFTKGREIDELRNRERYYWMMRKHGKGINQATNSGISGISQGNNNIKSTEKDGEGEFAGAILKLSHTRANLMSAPATSEMQSGSHAYQKIPQRKIEQARLSTNDSTWTYFNQTQKVTNPSKNYSSNTNKRGDTRSRIKQWYGKKNALTYDESIAQKSEHLPGQHQQQTQQRVQQNQNQSTVKSVGPTTSIKNNIMTVPTGKEQKSPSTSSSFPSSSYMEQYNSSKANSIDQKNGNISARISHSRSLSVDSLDAGRRHHHNTNIGRETKGMLPPPVSLGFPGSIQQQQQQNSLHRSFKPRRAHDGMMMNGSNRKSTSGEFISINLHRASENGSGKNQGNNIAVPFNNVEEGRQRGTLHHDQRSYSFDGTNHPYSSGDDSEYDSSSLDSKANDNGVNHPIRLQSQSSRQNQDNIKYARVIAKNGSASMKMHKKPDNGSSWSSTGCGSDNSANSSNINNNNIISNNNSVKETGSSGRSPLHRQTLVSSSTFHKWPSVGRTRKSLSSFSKKSGIRSAGNFGNTGDYTANNNSTTNNTTSTSATGSGIRGKQRRGRRR